MLRGTIANDDMNVQGTAKLALSINTAELKNGQSVPVHAAIVGFEPVGSLGTMTGTGNLSPSPNGWNPSEQVVDQIGVTKDVDLHSRLSSQNSGVFVATGKDDVKLSKGGAVNLAIAPADNAPSTAGL